jgi:hypothetical protein
MVNGGHAAEYANATNIPVLLIVGALALFVGPGIASALYFPLVVTLGTAGAWYLAALLRASLPGRYAVLALYLGNPWLWDRIISGHTGIVLGYALFPFLLAVGQRFITRPRIGGFALHAVLASAMFTTSLQIAILAMPGSFVALIAMHPRKRRVLAALGLWLGTLPFVIASNLFWLLPSLHGSYENLKPYYPTIGEFRALSAIADPLHVFTFGSYWLRYVETTLANVPPAIWVWRAALWTLLVVLTRNAIRRRDTRGIVATFALGASLLLTFGAWGPFDGIGAWMFLHVPEYAMFREPSKFVFISAFFVILLIARARHGKAASVSQAAAAVFAALTFIAVTAGNLRATNGLLAVQTVPRGTLEATLEAGEESARNGRRLLLPAWGADVLLWPGGGPVIHPLSGVHALGHYIAPNLIGVSGAADTRVGRFLYDLYDGMLPDPIPSLRELGISGVTFFPEERISTGATGTPFLEPAIHPYEALAQNPAFTPRHARLPALTVTEFSSPARLIRGRLPTAHGLDTDMIDALRSSGIVDVLAESSEKHPLHILADWESLARQAHAGIAMRPFDRLGHDQDPTRTWVSTDWLALGHSQWEWARCLHPRMLYTQSEAPLAVTVPRADARMPLELYAELAGRETQEIRVETTSTRFTVTLTPRCGAAWVHLGTLPSGARTFTLRKNGEGTPAIGDILAISSKDRMLLQSTFATLVRRDEAIVASREHHLPAVSHIGQRTVWLAHDEVWSITAHAAGITLRSHNVRIARDGVTKTLAPTTISMRLPGDRHLLPPHIRHGNVRADSLLNIENFRHGVHLSTTYVTVPKAEIHDVGPLPQSVSITDEQAASLFDVVTVHAPRDVRQRAFPLAVNEINATRYEIRNPEGKAGTLLFASQFEEGWEAHAHLRDGRMQLLEHREANGWENAWILPPSATRVTLAYAPQARYHRLLNASATLNGVLLLLSLGDTAWSRRKRSS